MTEKIPFFSVVIPMYNKEPHISRAIESVLVQSFDDYEILVIDDSSTDKGSEIVLSYDKEKLRLLHRSTPGPGGYAARNLGIRKSKGKYIAFLDADDTWNPGHLESLRTLSEKYPEQQFLGSGWTISEEQKNTDDPYYQKWNNRGSHKISVGDYLRETLAGRRPVHTVISCVKKSSFTDSGLFPEDKGAKRGGDLHAWLKMICCYKSMAWSSHLGGVYYKDSINMVTRTAPSSLHLLGRDVFRELAENLDSGERLMLKKYFNRRIKNSWIGNSNRGEKAFFLPFQLFWKGDFFNAFRFSFRSFIPPFIVKKLRIFRSLVGRS